MSTSKYEVWSKTKDARREGIKNGRKANDDYRIDILADPKGGNYAKPIIRKVSGKPYPSDPAYKKPGAKVMHVPDLDTHTVCASLVECLHDVKAWVDKHPKAVPIPILLEFKTAEPFVNIIGGADKIDWDKPDLLASVDKEIRSVFDAKQLITPDDMRRKPMTLEQSVLKFGWPDLDSARGRVFFIMDNDNAVRTVYRKGRENLEGRVIFTNSNPGSPDCAFQKLNDPTSKDAVANIQKQVAAGYWVRTRADVPLDTVIDHKCNTAMRDAALKSGAQIVSTDFPAYGMSSRWECDYAVRLAGGRTARCNPVNGGKNCSDANLEPPEYHRN